MKCMEQREENQEKKSGSMVRIRNIFILILLAGMIAGGLAIVFRDIIRNQSFAIWKKAPEEMLQVQASETDNIAMPEEQYEEEMADSEAEEEEYATSHTDDVANQEEISEPAAVFPVRLTDVYAEKGSIAVFRCYDPEATQYLWESYNPETKEWKETGDGDVMEHTDELRRKISIFPIEADERHNEFTIRCRICRESADDIISTATLHILPEIASISINEYASEAGNYIIAREIPVQVSFEDGSTDTITGLNGLYFLRKEESTQQGTTVSGNMTETITTVYTACDYDYLDQDHEVLLRYQGRNVSLDTSADLIAEDHTPPDIKELSVSDFEVSTIDRPVPVTVTIVAEDDVTEYPELAYAFLPEGQEPDNEDWTKGNPTLEVSVTQNGTWIAYCKDESGNIATQEKNMIVVDNKAPIVELSLANDTWCSENQILVTATDGMSVEYCYSCVQTGEDSGWIEKNEYSVTDNGNWTVKVRDAAGNITEQEILIDRIDHQAPVIRSIMEK